MKNQGKNKVLKKMKNDLTTGTWQYDIWCPINITLLSVSDVEILRRSPVIAVSPPVLINLIVGVFRRHLLLPLYICPPNIMGDYTKWLKESDPLATDLSCSPFHRTMASQSGCFDSCLKRGLFCLMAHLCKWSLEILAVLRISPLTRNPGEGWRSWPGGTPPSLLCTLHWWELL